MDSKTFQVEVKVMETVPNFSKLVDGKPEYETIQTPKVVTFKKLDQTDRDQHEIHFMIMGHYTSGAAKTKGKNKVVIDHRFALDITQAFMDEMCVLGDDFKVSDRELVLSDSGALMKLARVLIPEHVIPFFLQLMESMTT